MGEASCDNREPYLCSEEVLVQGSIAKEVGVSGIMCMRIYRYQIS